MSNPHRFSVFFPILLSASSAVLTQTQVTIGSSKDNTLYENPAGTTSNGAGEHMFVGRTNQVSNSIRRALFAFPISSSIPAGSTITGATLTLSMSRTISGSHLVHLHRVTADWGEGASDAGGNEGGGAPAMANDATWLHRFFDTVTWSTPGGTYSPTPSASQVVGGVGFYTWGSTPAMVSDVQQWLDDPASNFGWILIGNESTGLTSKRFDTKENLNPVSRPQLTVVYQPPVGIHRQGDMPEEFALYQNYPNPFNPSTNIHFSIANVQLVSLKVYNLLGQEVATLVNEVKQAGRHEVTWDARGLPGGMYYYRLQARDFVAAKKLLLLR